MKINIALLLLLGLMAGAFVTGCKDSSSPPPAPGPAPTNTPPPAAPSK